MSWSWLRCSIVFVPSFTCASDFPSHILVVPMCRIAFILPLFASSLAAAGSVHAQVADVAPGEIIRLTPEQKQALSAQQTEATVNAARSGLSGSGSDRNAIHGEIGAMVGTNGARGVFGTAAIPLGDNAGAVISFENSRYGRIRGR